MFVLGDGWGKMFSLYSIVVNCIVRLDRRGVTKHRRKREKSRVNGHSIDPVYICLYSLCNLDDVENRSQAIAYIYGLLRIGTSI